MAESADPYKKKIEGQLPNLFNPIDGNRIVRAVPLVYYENLERHIVGTAILREDGSFTAEVYPNDRNRVKEILESRELSQMSFAFRPPLIDLVVPEEMTRIEKKDRPLPEDPAYD